MTAKEKEIQHNMKILGLTREEAEQMWLDDNSDEMTPEQAELTEKAKKLGRHYEKSGKERKKAVKERKVDETKKVLLLEVKGVLENMGAEIKEVKTETEILFLFDKQEYTFKLTKHRPPKK